MDIGGFSAVGPRDANEDSFYVRSFTEVKSFSNGVHTFVMVSDGMGGYQGGDVASGLAASCAERYVDNLLTMARGNMVEFEPDVALQEIVQNAHEAILAESEARGSASMGATFVGAFISPTHAWIGHVGDSRAYLIENGEVTQLTEDHSQVGRMLSRGVITEEEAQNHPARNRIERALGFDDHTVDITETDLGPQSMLLLCSDGAYTVLSKEDFARMAARDIGAAQMSKRMVNAAIKAKTDDNTTVVIAHAGKPQTSSRKAGGSGATARQRPVRMKAGNATLRRQEPVPARHVKRVAGDTTASYEALGQEKRGPSAAAIALVVALMVALAAGGFLLYRILGNVPTKEDEKTVQESVQTTETGAEGTDDGAADTPVADGREEQQEGKEREQTLTARVVGTPALRYIDASGTAQLFTYEPYAFASDPLMTADSYLRVSPETDEYGRPGNAYRTLDGGYLEDLRKDCEGYKKGTTGFESALSHVVDKDAYLKLVQSLAGQGADAIGSSIVGLALLDADLRIESGDGSDSEPKASAESQTRQDPDQLRQALNLSEDYRPSFVHGDKPASCQKYIVLHDTEGSGTAADTIAYWDGNGSGVAAHFVVNKDGSIVQCVPLDKITHHAGFGDTGHNQQFGVEDESRDDRVGTSPIGPEYADYGMNSWSVGIEMVHLGGVEDYPEEQLSALDGLIAYIDSYFGFESTIIDHKTWRTTNSDTSAEFAGYLANYQAMRRHA